MRGVTTQLSDTKSITACTTALKKEPDTRGTAPSLLRMRAILLQSALARYKLHYLDLIYFIHIPSQDVHFALILWYLVKTIPTL